MRIGVDVGGTNTDAVLMDGETVVASTKKPTTPNVGDGIVDAISTVIDSARIAVDKIAIVSIGTTHFTNAFVQRRGLDAVGAIRIGLPAAKALPPYAGWPAAIREAVGGQSVMVRGGHQCDGRETAPLDEIAIARAATRFRKSGLTSIAISAVFAPVNRSMEERAAEIVRNEAPDAAVTLSSMIGRVGLLERENAGIMNASLASLARATIGGFREALEKLGVNAPFYISQNDGTLMSAAFVEQYPVLTFASGPTNSMRGAAYLLALDDALVADIGGTTTDVGALHKGFPRESSTVVDIGGVRTNFRMPDVFAIGLGGGSLVTADDGRVKIGPQSVGYRITEDALVFGGTTTTATDIAVAAGYADIGDAERVKHLDDAFVARAVDEIHRLIEDGVDRMKTDAADRPLVLVGGGAILVDRPLKGVSAVYTDESAGVANAIGASIAQVGGEVDKVYSYEAVGRDKAIEQAVAEASANAAAAGAAAQTVKVTDLEELPLAYMPGGAVRLRVKVAGDLAA
ncbi:MAG: hydantoinase/oxoprolinase family protein [Pseudomonadota bacterium]